MPAIASAIPSVVAALRLLDEQGKRTPAPRRRSDTGCVERVWCTGFRTDFSWLEPAALTANGQAIHERGIATSVPGLYFVGLHFPTSLASAMVHGVGRDANRVADRGAARAGVGNG
jgi:hypothetical protein